ncbi:hypothetical protein OG930_35175 [Streptomyces sp. NBC_01799]|nr:hypothetical protein OG930_35175 [Streptomyces sp. NBC_01799]
MKGEDVGAGVVAGGVEVEAGPGQVVEVEFGGQEALAIAQRTGQHLAERADDGGATIQLATLPALVTLPTHAATVYADTLGLTATAPPLSMPMYTVSAIWHGTTTDNPAHAWLRRLVDDATRRNE